MMIFTSICGVVDGIWWSIDAAELGSLMLTDFFLIKYRKRYHYA